MISWWWDQALHPVVCAECGICLSLSLPIPHPPSLLKKNLKMKTRQMGKCVTLGKYLSESWYVYMMQFYTDIKQDACWDFGYREIGNLTVFKIIYTQYDDVKVYGKNKHL